MAFHVEVKFTNLNRIAKEHDIKLKELFVAIRWILHSPFEDEPFDFYLIGSRQEKHNV